MEKTDSKDTERVIIICTVGIYLYCILYMVTGFLLCRKIGSYKTKVVIPQKEFRPFASFNI